MKLTGSKKIIMGGAVALVVALAGIIGFAQQQGQSGQERPERHARGEGGKGFRGGFGGGFFESLNLTDAQKEQMKQIAERYHQSFKANRGEGRERGERRGFDPLSGAAFDESAVRAAAQARANEMVEMEVARAHMMYEMYNVLTPEQKAQLATERQQREQKRQEWRSRRQANPGVVQ
jgi:Spy/CpxP family protein refolding chaperone